ncbi:hypothetical protein ACIHCX_10600 [Streptomyces sp. NPDC052043]|uniref:hypothetical protein n=1 Tax=Streptomyces sp. NPDC052043 TaxID=3365684 RepID=UPI0037CFD69C
MPVSPRAVELRAALENALGEPVRLTTNERATQLRAPAPAGGNLVVWQRVIAALSTADRWGSTDTSGTPEIWANVNEGQR